MGPYDRWYGCYGGARGDLFTPESNRHPAKMAVGLCYRIFEHGRQLGYWQLGDQILDPMAGIFTTGIVGATLGYVVLGVELEGHFINLADQNIGRLMGKMPQAPRPVIFQGDARRLTELLAGADGAVTSPPYGDQVPSEPIAAWVLRVVEEQGMAEAVRRYRVEVMDRLPKHGRWSDENIQVHIEAAIRIRGGGHYSGPISSPPYADDPQKHKGSEGPGSGARARLPRSEHPGSVPYGSQTAQIGNLRDPRNDIDAVLTSPPYVGPPGKPGNATVDGESKLGREKAQPGQYTPSPSGAQIGNLRDPKGDIDAVLSSPPYGDTDINEFAMANQGLRSDKLTPDQLEQRNKAFSAGRHGYRSKTSLAARTEGQIGCLPDCGEQGETYLSAMFAVYRELHAVLKPSGVVCLVTKNPVKAGKIRRLDEDTIRLMEAAGFELIERVQAMLTEELGEQITLDGGSIAIRREHKSFFKRLFERKRPDLRVNNEDVLFFRRVEG